MSYQTDKTVTSAFTSRFISKWNGVYPIQYENHALNPVPSDSSIWLEFGVIFDPAPLAARKTIDGDYAIDRVYGIARVKAHVPLGKYTAELSDITDAVGKTFSSRYWCPEHVFLYPTAPGWKGKVGNHYVKVIDTRFHFDKRNGEIVSESVLPSVKAAFAAAGSTLLDD